MNTTGLGGLVFQAEGIASENMGGAERTARLAAQTAGSAGQGLGVNQQESEWLPCAIHGGRGSYGSGGRCTVHGGVCLALCRSPGQDFGA